MLLVREKGQRSAEERTNALIRQAGLPDFPLPAKNRISTFPSDITKPRCGLSTEHYARAVQGITRVIHTAASVRFDLPLADAHLTNVVGTQNLLSLAEDIQCAGMLRRVSYVGTAYVAGERRGLIREEDLDMGQRFRNSYEKTKCEAEKLVRSRGEKLPITILRPSIIVGDSQTGITQSFKTLYWPLKAFVKWHWRLLPGFPETVIDVVPVDYVAAAIACLTLDERATGRCVHLCAGPAGSATLGELARFAGRFFQRPQPIFVNPRLFLALLRPVLLATLRGRRRRIMQEGPVYRPYFRMRLIFDTRHADALLTPHGIRPPHVKDYIERILKYCVESDWGQKAIEARRAQKKFSS